MEEEVIEKIKYYWWKFIEMFTLQREQ